MTSHGTPVKYLNFDNAVEHQSKFQKVYEKYKTTLEYTTTHTPHLNIIIKRRFSVIKEGALSMLLNKILNDTSQKMLCTEIFHTC